MCNNINKLLNDVINDAINLGIPISQKIERKVYIDEKRYDRLGACYKYYFPPIYQIHLSQDVLKANENKIKNIIAHEVLHTISMEHDTRWKYYKIKMNNKLGYNIETQGSWQEIFKK